jgi:hypothetical protein
MNKQEMCLHLPPITPVANNVIGIAAPSSNNKSNNRQHSSHGQYVRLSFTTIVVSDIVDASASYIRRKPTGVRRSCRAPVVGLYACNVVFGYGVGGDAMFH